MSDSPQLVDVAAAAPLVDVDPPWLELARRALWLLANGGEQARAARLVERMTREHGDESLGGAMQAWADTCLAYFPPPSPGEPVRLAFVSGKTGARRDVDEIPPDVVWAGRLLAARAADDEPMFRALVDTAPDDRTYSARVWALLELCARNIAAALAAGTQPTSWPEIAAPTVARPDPHPSS